MAILLGSVDICIKTKPQKKCTEKIFLLVLLVFSMALAMKTVRINAIELESESVQSEESLISGKKLVFGNENLADEDTLVLVMYGDGFTCDEQDAFYTVAYEMAEYIIETSPWDEVADSLKIYAVGCISEESGIKGENCSSYYDAYYDVKDTYFGTMFWYYGTERLLHFSDEYTAESQVAALTADWQMSIMQVIIMWQRV